MASESGACRVMQGCPISTVGVCARVHVREIWENPTQPYIGWAWTTKHARSQLSRLPKNEAVAALLVSVDLIACRNTDIHAGHDGLAPAPSAKLLALARTYRTLSAPSASHSATPLRFEVVSAHA